MKKCQQLSLRSKTVQSQDGQNQTNYWIGNLQAQKILSKVGQQITQSFIQYNKQNQQRNISCVHLDSQQSHSPLYQSVCQSENFVTHISPLKQRNIANNIITEQNKEKKCLIISLQERCKKLQKQLLQISIQHYKNPPNNEHPRHENSQVRYHNEQQPSTQYPSIPKHFECNLIERLYEIQIEQIKKQKNSIAVQFDKLQQIFSNKQQQLLELSKKISQNIQKQQNQKDSFIKQINFNNIQIKRFKQEIKLHKSQKQALKIVLKQKQITIDNLNTKIIQIEVKKKKIEGYENQLRESQLILNQIQFKMNKLKKETEVKENTINNSNKKINALQTKLLHYQQQITKLQKSVLSSRQSSTHSTLKIQQLQSQCQQWKNKYCQLKQQIQQIAQLQIKYKNANYIINQLQNKIKQFVISNQKLKIQSANQHNLKLKINQQQIEINQLKNNVRSKIYELQNIQNNNTTNRGLHQKLQTFVNRVNVLQTDLLQKQQEIRLLKTQIQQKQLKINSLHQQLQQKAKQRIRIKQLQLSIDKLFSQNQKLHCSLLQKIGSIQNLQRRLNTIQSKNATISNQCTKLRTMNDTLSAQLSQSESKLQNMKNRWELEFGAKLGLQEKCNKLHKEAVSYKTKIEHLDQNCKLLKDKQQEMVIQFEQKEQRMVAENEQLFAYKKQSLILIQHMNQKIKLLHFSMAQLKSQIDRQMSVQNQAMCRIDSFQIYTVELNEELSVLKMETESHRKLWTQVQEVAGIALQQLR